MEFHETNFCHREFLGKNSCIWFPQKSVSLIKIPWVSFLLEKSQWKPIKLIWSQSNWIWSKKISWSSFLQSKIHGNCLHQWWKKTKTTLPTGSPCETISHKCNAWKLVSLKVNPRKLIWLMQKLWKLTSTIDKPEKPSSSMGNPRKLLSTFRNQWKSVTSDRKFHCSILFEWKIFVDKFTSKKFSLTKVLCKLTEHPRKTSVNWWEARRNQLRLKRFVGLEQQKSSFDWLELLENESRQLELLGNCFFIWFP